MKRFAVSLSLLHVDLCADFTLLLHPPSQLVACDWLVPVLLFAASEPISLQTGPRTVVLHFCQLEGTADRVFLRHRQNNLVCVIKLMRQIVMSMQFRLGLIIENPELLLDKDWPVHLIAIDTLAQVLVDLDFALESLAEHLRKVVHALVQIDSLILLPAGRLALFLCMKAATHFIHLLNILAEQLRVKQILLHDVDGPEHVAVPFLVPQ